MILSTSFMLSLKNLLNVLNSNSKFENIILQKGFKFQTIILILHIKYSIQWFIKLFTNYVIHWC